MNDGKKLDVLIEDIFETNSRTGIERLSQYVTVYADPGSKETMLRVEGIMTVTQFDQTEYMVKIDPRYDRDYVKKEIEAALLCA